IARGLFGALNVQPEGAEWYRSQVSADDLQRATYNASQVPAGSLNCPAATPTKCTFTVNGKTVNVIKAPGGFLQTTDTIRSLITTPLDLMVVRSSKCSTPTRRSFTPI